MILMLIISFLFVPSLRTLVKSSNVFLSWSLPGLFPQDLKLCIHSLLHPTAVSVPQIFTKPLWTGHSHISKLASPSCNHGEPACSSRWKGLNSQLQAAVLMPPNCPKLWYTSFVFDSLHASPSLAL